jgi:DtxR family Mn-dependent transcriptional regulator
MHDVTLSIDVSNYATGIKNGPELVRPEPLHDRLIIIRYITLSTGAPIQGCARARNHQRERNHLEVRYVDHARYPTSSIAFRPDRFLVTRQALSANVILPESIFSITLATLAHAHVSGTIAARKVYLGSEKIVTEHQPPEESYSKANEDFLKAVYLLQQDQDRVQTSVLAEALNISAPSTTEMAKKLAKANLVIHEPYRGVRLTESGERVALEIVRRHRLLELFLVQTLGYSWDEVHEEAEQLEHAVSDHLMQRIAESLGNPRYDPHGDPIPGPEGDIYTRELTPLADWPIGEKGLVARLRDQSSDMLRYLDEKGLVIAAQVEVLKTDPFDGPLTLLVDGSEQVIGVNVAQYVLVSPYEDGL